MFLNKFHISAEPGTPNGVELDQLSSFSAIINVSDTPCLTFAYLPFVNLYWFPISEMSSWGYAPFYGAAKVIDQFREDSRSILFHCHAGVCRSVLVAYAILLSNGFSDKEIVGSNRKFEDSQSELARLQDKACIPKDIVGFLAARHVQPTYSIGGLLAHIKSDNFYAQKKRNK